MLVMRKKRKSGTCGAMDAPIYLKCVGSRSQGRTRKPDHGLVRGLVRLRAGHAERWTGPGFANPGSVFESVRSCSQGCTWQPYHGLVRLLACLRSSWCCVRVRIVSPPSGSSRRALRTATPYSASRFAGRWVCLGGPLFEVPGPEIWPGSACQSLDFDGDRCKRRCSTPGSRNSASHGPCDA